MIDLRHRAVKAAVTALTAALVASPAAANLTERVTHYELQGQDNRPYSIVNGADGNLWFTEPHGNAIGRITPAGQLSRFKLPDRGSQPRGITVGPLGDIWFTEAGTNRIGVMDISGNVLAEYPLPTPHAKPWDLVAPSDANIVWFTERGADQIASITGDGTITEYPLTPGSRPTAIGADFTAHAWFTERAGNAIGRIDTASSDPFGTLVLFRLPNGARPTDINVMGDGNMWFGELAGSLGRITADGSITEFPVPGHSAIASVTSGNTGTVWFTQSLLARVGFMTSTGQFGTFAKTRPDPVGIAAGSDSGMWFCEGKGDSIGRVEGG